MAFLMRSGAGAERMMIFGTGTDVCLDLSLLPKDRGMDRLPCRLSYGVTLLLIDEFL